MEIDPVWASLLPMWLRENAKDAAARARRPRARYEQMANKSTPYAQALLGIAEAHEETVEVYRRRLRELPSGREGGGRG